MEKMITGRVWVYGDNVDTDVIIPARHLTLVEPKDLARHCMEDIDKSFAAGVEPGDIVAGGANFGCGSSREHAPLALLGSGVSAVVAANFARIFFRNAVNVGLPIVECPGLTGHVKKGDVLAIDVDAGTVNNRTTGESFSSEPFPPFLKDLINSGGLVEYAKRRLRGEA
ncbi:MAG: 3-isopropylmalate dehydratase small subunit [Planctomycetota bacterium]|jgi:3-isopropylmalate/(R)-2-methylmalate dehydratase small subunit|nr:3-isopropylmalate dehydratase small subunit [Planctomycetota bacterium]